MIRLKKQNTYTYIYIYIYIYRRLGGVSTACPPPANREIDFDFDFDFDSFVRAVRASEAKLCECVRESFLIARAEITKLSSGSPAGFACFLLPCMWVLTVFPIMFFAFLLAFAALRLGFNVFYSCDVHFCCQACGF